MFNDVSQWCIRSRNFSLIDIGITRASSHGEASHRTAMVSSLWNHDSESLKDHEKSPFVMIFLNHHIKSPGLLEKIMVNITTCFSLPSSGPMAWPASPGLVAGLASGMGRPRAVGFPRRGLWPPGRRGHAATQHQVPTGPGMGEMGEWRQRDFHIFFKDMMTGKNT